MDGPEVEPKLAVSSMESVDFSLENKDPYLSQELI